MPEKIAELGEGLELWKVGIDEAREQDVNARVLAKNKFEHLARTLAKDKRLEQLPLLAMTKKRGLEIVSGHHRVRAARTAGLDHYFALVDVTDLTPDQIKAKQLAHNALQGDDDEEILRRIYESIQDVDARIESAIDGDALAERIRVEVPNMDMGMEYKTALITFLPYEMDRFERAVEILIVEANRDEKKFYLAELKLVEVWKRVMARVGKEYEVRAMGTQMVRIAAIVEEYFGKEPSIEEEYLPVRDAVGVGMLTAVDHRTVKDAVKKAGGLVELAKMVGGDPPPDEDVGPIPGARRKRIRE